MAQGSFNGTGTFVRGHDWTVDEANSVPVSADRMDEEFDGMATALSNCITKDGQTTVTASIPMNNNKITGLGDATADTDALNRQTADGRFQPLDADLTAIAALANTNGNFIVGDGSAWVAESGATARTSLGVGYASEANMEADASGVVVTPDVLLHHKGVSKSWALVNSAGTTVGSYNVTSTSEPTTGALLVTWGAVATTVNYITLATAHQTSTSGYLISSYSKSTSATNFYCVRVDTYNSLVDPTNWNVAQWAIY